ncbi:5'-3' exonuclease H3TH domain-containing protein [Egicoccus sp. AB-alg2]|uniref:5'-3' exonuclease n=1 Tax=Egicoccus sp. AB-alg2 TaxID=3242693 RepID=UPI00359D0043
MPTVPSSPRVLAVDGNSLGHRGFHSARHDAEREGTTAPFVTGAVVGMLASAWVEGPYDAVVVGFDHPVNQRKLDFPEYKAHRAATHPDLPGHLQTLRGHLRECGFTVVEVEGAEADDLLAATVDACAARSWPCDVLSSDRDLTALVGPTTRLLRPRATFADLKVYDEAAVRAEYGVSPAQYTDLAALRGDPSDGLDGATGIGPKMAARLLRDYGSVPGMYASLQHLPPKVEAALRASRDRVERNLELMAPIPHLSVDVDGAVAAGVDCGRLERTLDELRLFGPARRFVRAVTAPPPPPMPPMPAEPDDLLPALAGALSPTPVTAAPLSGEQATLF